MKLLDALKYLNGANLRSGPEFNVALISGCSALTLKTFLAAHLSVFNNEKKFSVQEAPYGDIVNALQSGYSMNCDGLVLLIEYSNLDPRLGLRRSSSWTDGAIDDIIRTVGERLDSLRSIICGSTNRRTVVHPPALQLPPIGAGGSWQQSSLETSLAVLWGKFCTSILPVPGVFIAHPEAGAAQRPRDVDGELNTDFPYDQATASAVCEGLAKCMMPPSPLKGIITDLDDTLWNGLVGEVGAGGVHWNLDGKSQIHAVYQQFLTAAGSRGILIAVASKNDQNIVDVAMQRDDLLLDKAHVYPIIANWEPKSHAVSQILKAWNIGADAVAFVDDNPYELDEVARAHPGIKTVQFYPKDAARSFAAINHLRDLCYRETQSEEDTLRLASIRASAEMNRESAGAASMDDFLAGLQATVKFETSVSPDDKRPFELLNKTNQFNLNGKRYTESEWVTALTELHHFHAVIGYTDKFGALGRIGVLLAHLEGETVIVDQWVQSCRAFSRRIEHATLRFLVESFPNYAVRFSYRPTDKNKPLIEMLGDYVDLNGDAISAEQITARIPKIYASIAVADTATVGKAI